MRRQHIIKLALFLVIFFGLQFLVGRALRCDYEKYSRYVLHDLHTADKVECLFLGASHIYRGINPYEVEEAIGLKTYLASTASQEVDQSLAVLKQVYSEHPELKKVFIDLDYSNILKPANKNRKNLRVIYEFSNYLTNKKIKYSYLLHATSPKYWLNAFLEIGKQRVYVDPRKILLTFKSYITLDYWKYKAPAVYKGRGFFSSPWQYKMCIKKVYKSEKIPEMNLYNNFDDSIVKDDWKKYVTEIEKFCKINNIELVFLSVPETDFFIWNIGNYDSYVKYIKDFIKPYCNNYYDFNLCKLDYLELRPEDFYDDNHMNEQGAAKITDVFIKLLLTENSARDDMFYNSINEKFADMPKKVFGYKMAQDESCKTLHLMAVGNVEDSEFSYDYYYLNKKENIEQPIMLNTKETCINYPENKSGKMKVITYIGDQKKDQIEIDFNTKWIK